MCRVRAEDHNNCLACVYGTHSRPCESPSTFAYTFSPAAFAHTTSPAACCLCVRYHHSGAWVQCQAVLRYLEYAERFAIPSDTDSADGAGVPQQLQVTAEHYHHTISALCAAQGFSPALALYQEMQDKAQR